MRRLIALSLLSLACMDAAAANVDVDVECSVHSDYGLTLNERSVILTRDAGSPRAIVMRQGRMFVDDAWVTLTPADSQRIAAFEAGTRAAMPQAQAIGRAAADIAFTALGELAVGFSNDPVAARAKVARSRAQLDARLMSSVTPTHFDGRDLGAGIAQAVGDLLPSMIGDMVGGAISAAFSGDASRLKRLDNLDAQIEARVKPRADALEIQAQDLCRRVTELDAIDDALDYRHDGKRLQLLEIDPTSRRKPGSDGKAAPASALD